MTGKDQDLILARIVQEKALRQPTIKQILDLVIRLSAEKPELIPVILNIIEEVLQDTRLHTLHKVTDIFIGKEK